MQFLLIGYDGTDAFAPERRQRAREAHLAAAAHLKSQGHFITGGAILDARGAMIGSAVVFDFPDRPALERNLATDPYVTERVWQRFEVHPFRTAQLPDA